MNETILIVEDDHKLRSGLRDNLEFEGYHVEEAWNFTDAEEKWRAAKPSLVILDLMLPGRSGYQLLKEMRTSGYSTPVIILTARGELSDKVKGFRLGCDDYVVKPFSIIELLERIKALLRRSISPEAPIEKIQRNLLCLDIRNQRLVSNAKVYELPLMEFELLNYFLNNHGRVISRRELLAEVWHSSSKMDTRTVDVYVSNVRKKLVGSGCKIQAVYKVGYRFEEISDD